MSAVAFEHLPEYTADGMLAWAQSQGAAMTNVYVVDDDGQVHDVAYELDAAVAKAMAKTIDGGVAAAERPSAKKAKASDDS